jgi:hypothetical protein
MIPPCRGSIVDPGRGRSSGLGAKGSTNACSTKGPGRFLEWGGAEREPNPGSERKTIGWDWPGGRVVGVVASLAVTELTVYVTGLREPASAAHLLRRAQIVTKWVDQPEPLV